MNWIQKNNKTKESSAGELETLTDGEEVALVCLNQLMDQSDSTVSVRELNLLGFQKGFWNNCYSLSEKGYLLKMDEQKVYLHQKGVDYFNNNFK